MNILLTDLERAHLKRTLEWVLVATQQEDSDRKTIEAILSKIELVKPIRPSEI